MKRHISIFAFLLSAFAAVGVVRAESFYYWALSTHPCTITDSNNASLEFNTLNKSSGGYYHIFYGDFGVTEMFISDQDGSNSITANEQEGLRFKGWYTKASGWSGEADVSQIDDQPIEAEHKIYYSKIKGAGLSTSTYRRPTIVAVYVPVHAIMTAVSPSGAGTVTVTGGNGDGTVDAGGSVTLTATANAGYVFSKWADGDNTTNPRTISGITADATYTAEFRRLSVDKPKVTTDFTYDGTQKTCATEGSHYTVTGNKGTNAGDYTFTAKLESGYTWSDDGTSADYEVKWKINKATIESVTLATVSVTYDGNAHQPGVNSVTASGKGFSSASAGWTVAYTRGGAATTDFTKAGTITVTVTGKDGLSGTASATFTIAKKTISTTGVGFSDKSVTYDGTLKSITASSIPEGVKATYSNNSRTDAGSQTTTVNFEPTDTENFTVLPTSKTATLTVTPAAITAIALSATSATYDGQPHQPQVASVTANGKTFTDAAVGWDVSYDKTDFTSVGNIQVTATGKKNLTSSANTTFEIKSKSITVTFNPNGGNAPSPASKTVQYPGTYGTLPTCTRKGYDLKGWWTAKEGGTQITETTSVESTASQTLYARWEAKRYTLTIALKEGESYGVYRGPQDYQLPDPLIFGETNLNEIAVACKKDDADFQGYFTSAGAMVYDAQGRNVKGALGEYWTNNYPTGTYCYDGNLTLSARFADPREHYEVTVTVSPDEAGTVDPSGTATYVEGSNIVLTATENTGYSFWHWTKNGAEVSTAKEYPITVTADATYTAVFTGNVYKVYYNGAGGSPDFQEKSVRYGETYGDPPAAVTQAGFNFEGWYTKTQGRGTRVNGTDSVAVLDEEGLDLYANWTAKTEFDVIWVDPTGRNASITNSPVAKDTEISAAPDLTANWYRNWDGEYWISGWNPSLPQTVTGDLTLTALRMSISDVLDCSNLVFTVGASNWKPVDDSTAKNGSCMRLDVSSGDDVLATSVSTNGTLSFRWKGGKSGVKLWLRKGGTDLRGFELESSNTWKDESIFIENASSEKIEIGFHLQTSDLSLSYCAIDSVAWVPGGEPPVPPPVTLYTVTFHDPSGTFDDDVQYIAPGSAATAPERISDKFDPKACGWDRDFSQVMEDITVNAVWTCRVEFVDLEGGNPPVTNKVGYNQSVVAPTAFTPPANKHFGGWDPSVPATIKSNSVFTVIWTDNPTYTVTYSWDKETQTDTKKQDVPLTLKGAIFTRAGYEQDGWSKSPDGSVKDFELGGTYSDDADLMLYPTWKELKPVVVDEIARALDCEDSGLTFETAGNWSVITNGSFAKKGDSYLRDLPDEAKLKTTISQSGTLTFWWKAPVPDNSSYENIIKVQTNGKDAVTCNFKDKDKKEEWKFETLYIDASQGEVELTFESLFDPEDDHYRALDFFTWTPDRKEPEYADTDTPVTGFSMADGKLGFSFVGDGSTYHLLGTNDLVAPMPWPMVFETNKASGTILFDIPVKADEPKMFYRIRELMK